MSSASHSAFSAPFATTARVIRLGQALAIAGAALAVLSFFLPWIRFTAGETVLQSMTGWRIAGGAILQSTSGEELFRGSSVSYLVPAVGLIVLVLVLVNYLKGYVTELEGFAALGATVLSVITLLVILGQILEAQRMAEGTGVDLRFQIGMIGVFLALIGLTAAGVLNLRAVRERNPAFKGKVDAWGFLAPAAILVVLFFFIPIVILFRISLLNLSSANFSDYPRTFIGLGNYIRLFSDQFFPKILGNTFRYVVLTLGFFNVGLALGLALLTSHINRRVGFLFRVLWLLPRLTPSVIYILMWWRIAHQPPFGIINQLLAPFGVEPRYWLYDSGGLTWLFVIMTNGFVGASFGLILFSSAIEAIPKDLITAAKVDGASAWQIIRDITIPMLRWPLLFVTTYQTLSLLTSFEYILLLTEGGPGATGTQVWALSAYQRALKTYFGNNQWGYGAAWGFILVIIGLVLAVIYLRVFRFDDLVQEPKIDVL